MKSLNTLLCLFWAMVATSIACAQEVKTYQQESGEIHLCGDFPLGYLLQDTAYQKWFTEGYDDYQLPKNAGKWVKKLAKMEVEVYLGTWCGDSKYLVPRFVKAWDELGLDRKQLKFTALYDGSLDGKYKQGPNAEEEGKGIHRVPTFIFKEKGEEVARIVESPRNSLFTDLAQIGLGYPSEPNYRAASYMQELLDSQTIEEVRESYKTHLYAAYDLVAGASELSTLSRVYQEKGELKKAALVLEFNTRYFPYNPYVFKRYGFLLEKAGDKEAALQCFERVLQLNPDDKEAQEAKSRLASEKEGEEN